MLLHSWDGRREFGWHMDVLSVPIAGRPVGQAATEVKKEETGAKAAKKSKSPFFLLESHSLLAAAERIGQAAFVGIDPAVKRECQLVRSCRRRNGFSFSVKQAHRLRLMIVSQFDREVFVLEYFPVLNEKTVGIFVADSAQHPDGTFGNKRACENTGFSDDPEFPVIPKIIGRLAGVNQDAVGIEYLLADVAADNIGVVAGFREIIVLLLGIIIRKVKSSCEVALDDLFVGLQGVEVEMEHFYVVPDLDRKRVFPIDGDSIDKLAVNQEINFMPVALQGGGGSVDGVAADGHGADNEEQRE